MRPIEAGTAIRRTSDGAIDVDHYMARARAARSRAARDLLQRAGRWIRAHFAAVHRGPPAAADVSRLNPAVGGD